MGTPYVTFSANGFGIVRGNVKHIIQNAEHMKRPRDFHHRTQANDTEHVNTRHHRQLILNTESKTEHKTLNNEHKINTRQLALSTVNTK